MEQEVKGIKEREELHAMLQKEQTRIIQEAIKQAKVQDDQAAQVVIEQKIKEAINQATLPRKKDGGQAPAPSVGDTVQSEDEDDLDDELFVRDRNRKAPPLKASEVIESSVTVNARGGGFGPNIKNSGKLSRATAFEDDDDTEDVRPSVPFYKPPLA